MRRRRSIVVGTLSVALLIGTGRAAAQNEPLAHPNRLGFDVGVASAVGEIGLAYQYAPSSRWRLEGGLGWGFSGVQLSAMPKVAFGGACSLLLGAGPSLAVGGPYAQSGSAHQPQPKVIGWLNVDVPGVECHSDAGISFEAALGVTLALTSFHYDITDVGATIHAGNLLPQARLGLGWWF
jgi:hypothetical protein